MIEKVSAVATALALNQALYHALAALDVSKADPATQYYVKRTLLEFRLAGVDKDDATRARIKTLNDEITKYATQFQRNLQESQLKVVVKSAAELDGLPADYIKSHKPAADGTITLTSDSPDVTPVLKFAKSADLRKRIFLAYNNRAYPQNVAVLADLLKKREELANLLGYKHWSDLNAADKMAVNAPNIAKFIDEIDVASKPAAEREYKMLLASAQKQDPSLQQIPLSDRNYYFEQLRRSEFDFNSQSARPYFPVRPRAAGNSRRRLETVSRDLPAGERRRGVGPVGRHVRCLSTAPSNWDASTSTCIHVRARTSGSARIRCSTASAASNCPKRCWCATSPAANLASPA